MKRQNVIVIFIFCLVLFLISFIYGYYFTDKRISRKPDYNNEAIVDNSTDGIDYLEIIKEEVRISPNTLIENRIRYKGCNHTITNTSQASKEIVNMTEKEYKDYMNKNHPNIKVISFSVQSIVLREDRECLCPNHYIVGEFEGNVAVFKIDENGDKVLDKVFVEYPLSLLKEIDQQKLKDGIVVDSEDELSDVIENFIS